MEMRGESYSATGTRTRVARVRAEYPNQLDYSGVVNVTQNIFQIIVIGCGCGVAARMPMETTAE